MMLLLSISHAMCIAQPARTHVWQTTLSSNTPIAVSATWGSAERLAHRVRVRGPDGRLVPVAAEALAGSIAVEYRDRWRTRFAQTLNADLEPTGESTRVLKPIVVDRDAFKVWSVNGFSIDGEDFVKHAIGPDHVVFAHQLRLERYLSVWSASGEFVRKISLPMDARIGEIAVDELGVVYTYSLGHASRVGGMNFDGSPRDVNDVPVQVTATSIRRLPWADGSVVFDGDGVGIEARDGKQTMRVGTRRGSVIGVDGDTVVVAYLDRVSSELTERRYACTGESRGLPSFWLPPLEPHRSE